MSTTEEPAFDWSQAASLLGDDPNAVEPDMAVIVRELVADADVHFTSLGAKNPATDRKAISAEAHQLRGCLLNFGFTAVGTILYQLEKTEFPAENYTSMLEEAKSVFVTSRKMLAARYPSLELAE